MSNWERRDVVCLHLAAHDDARDRSPVPRALVAAGIGDAIEVGDSAAGRVRLIEDLRDLVDEGLVAAEEREVEGFGAPRTAYVLTETGREHAAAVRAEARRESVVVTNGTREEVTLGEVGQFVESETPLVTALARLTDDGTVPLADGAGTGFVDRLEPLATVRDAIEDSINRGSRTVVVGGSAGVGKTTLVREAVDRVAGDREDLVEARGDCPAEPTAPYDPLRQAFERVGGDLVEALPATDATTPPSRPEQVDVGRTKLFGEVADALRAASTDRPIVVFLDNLQWADAATLSLFAHLATTVTEWVYPVAFVGTYRSTAVADDNHPLPDVLERLERGGRCTDVTLGPLDRAATGDLLAAELGTQGVPSGFVERVHDRTGGVPLFVRETATDLLERGVVDPARDRYPASEEDVALPSAVSDQVAERLSALDEDSLALVRLGAVIGEYVPAAVLSAASDLPPETRREHVDLLVATHLWERAGAASAGRDVRFVSGAVREAVLDGLPRATAASYHERVAEALVAAHDDGDDQAARVAHHFEQAGANERAVAYYRRAGDHAAGAFADESALEHYRRALALVDDADDLGDADRAAVLADVAHVHLLVGEFDEAATTAAAGVDVAPERSEARCRLLGVSARARAKQAAYDEAEDTAERQRDLATDLGTVRLEAEAIRVLGLVAEGRGAYDEARERYERSLALSREAGDRWAEATNLKNLGGVTLRQGAHEEARDYFQDSLEAFRAIDDRQGEARCLNNLGETARRQGDLDVARRHLERSLEMKRELGNRHAVASTLGNLGLVAEIQGDLDGAREQFEEGLAAFRDIGDRRGEAKSLGNLGLLARRQGDYGEAREYFLESIELARELGDRPDESNTLHNLGLVAMARGSFERAREYFERSLAIDRDIEDRASEAAVVNGLGRLAMARGDHERARERLEEGLSIALEVDKRPEEANARHGLGELARRRGDHERAREQLETALELDEAGDMAFGAARVRLSLGRLALDEDDSERAREHAERARETFDELGGDHHRGRARLLLGRVAMAEGSTAADHLEAARSTFERVGAPHDALDALEHLAALADERGDDAAVERWCERATDLLETVHGAVAERHRGWIDRTCEG